MKKRRKKHVWDGGNDKRPRMAKDNDGIIHDPKGCLFQIAAHFVARSTIEEVSTIKESYSPKSFAVKIAIC